MYKYFFSILFLSTGLTWAWPTVHWWPDANPNKLYYGSPIPFPVKNGINDPDELNDRNLMWLPDGSTHLFINKKIYHNFKPLSDFVLQSEINFNEVLTPKYFYDDVQNLECYYLVSSDNKVYGWVHNLNFYWFNNYYYYFVDDGNPYHYLNINGALAPMVIDGIPFPELDNSHNYSIDFYYTRCGDAPGYFPETQGLTLNANDEVYIGSNILNYLGTDTVEADFAFIITDGSSLKINGNSSETQNIIYDTTFSKNKFETSGAITEVENENSYFDIKIIPNPSSGVFNIDIIRQNAAPNTITEIFIYNALGNLLLHEQNAAKLSVVLSDQPKGVYYLKVSVNSTSKYFKLIRS